MHLPELLRMYHFIASNNKWTLYWYRVLILITPFSLIIYPNSTQKVHNEKFDAI